MRQPLASLLLSRTLAFALLILASPAFAEKRAFVVGVNAYPRLAPEMQLQRPIADANAVGDTLRKLGFQVTVLTNDVTQRNFWRGFDAFKTAILPGDTVMFFFAGHGASIEGANYLIPGDIEAFLPGEEQSLTGRSMAEAAVIEGLNAKSGLAILVIDACRNNPFPKKAGERAMGVERGLAPSQPPSGIYSLYSAGLGQTALDSLSPLDTAKNSVFTRVFLDELVKPGINLVDFGENVKERVAALAQKEAQHQQVPAANNNILRARDVFLAGRTAGIVTANATTATPAPVTAPVQTPTPVTTAPANAAQPSQAIAGAKRNTQTADLQLPSLPPPNPILQGPLLGPQILAGHSQPIRSIVLSPDGKLIASGSIDGTIRFWTASSGAPRSQIKLDAKVVDIAFSPVGGLIASASDDGLIRIWTLATGALAAELKGHAGQVNAIAFSPDGAHLVSGGDDKSVKIWDVATGKIRFSVSDYKEAVKSVAFSPDGKLIASSGITQPTRLMDSGSGKTLLEMTGHFFMTNIVRFSPDGRQLATGGEDSDARLWDVATGKQLLLLHGHKGGVDALSFSPDGRALATGSWDSTARLWDTTSGKVLQDFKGGKGIMGSLAVSADATRLVTGSNDGNIRIWPVAVAGR